MPRPRNYYRNRINKKLGRYELAKTIHELLDIPLENSYPKTGGNIVNIVIDCLTKAIQRGETVRIPGFGTFYTKIPRKVHNIPNIAITWDTHASVKIPFRGRRRVFFRPSPVLLTMLNADNPNAREQRILARWRQ